MARLRGAMRAGRRVPRGMRWLAGAALALAALDLAFPPPLEPPVGGYGTVVRDRTGRMVRAFGNERGAWRLRVVLPEISLPLRRAVVGAEDRRFAWHPGVDPVAIVRAAWTNARAGRVVSGGSTITMQVARMLAPGERTWGAKLREAVRALQLERRLSKDEILELYLNLAPYGGSLAGVRAAAHAYFEKSPSDLSWGEAALLTAIPRDPNGLRPDRHPGEARRARNRVLARLVARGAMPRDALEEALREPVRRRRAGFPYGAPHFTEWIRREYPGESVIRSSLDSRVQGMVERLLAHHVESIEALGVTNGAVVVVDNATRGVLAMTGSRDYRDAANAGQVNGALAPRSPGSALKPFIYALAMDRGQVTPRYALEDVPVGFNGYQPANFDEKFRGIVTMREALRTSLNVPAVTVNARLGTRGLHALLERARVSTLHPDPAHYGLPIALGALEISLLEVCGLYAALADGGRFVPLTGLGDAVPVEPGAEVARLCSPEAAWMVADILSELDRPDFPDSWRSAIRIPKVAWKTGTSYGHKDAWSVGSDGRITIGVWVGNFDGRGARNLSGAGCAAPLMLRLFNAIQADAPGTWFIRPGGVADRAVCASSGRPPGPDCPRLVGDLYIPGVSSERACHVHRRLWIDRETGRRLCAECLDRHPARAQVFEIWPATVGTWLVRAGYPVERLPRHAGDCQRVGGGDAPRIYSPEPGAVFSLRKGARPGDRRILLLASTSSGVRTIHWLVDGRLVYTGSPAERVFIESEPGAHTAICIDETGRSSQSRFVVM